MDIVNKKCKKVGNDNDVIFILVYSARMKLGCTIKVKNIQSQNKTYAKVILD